MAHSHCPSCGLDPPRVVLSVVMEGLYARMRSGVEKCEYQIVSCPCGRAYELEKERKGERNDRGQGVGAMSVLRREGLA